MLLIFCADETSHATCNGMMNALFAVMLWPTMLLAIMSTIVAQEPARSDSLLREYERLWKASDSLRIQAMLMRMEASKQRRTADDDILASMQSRLVAERALVRQGATKAGISVADSVTLMGLRVKPDTGTASFYANEFHGRPTSSGEKYNMNDLTCAHRWLPFGTRLRVTNVSNGRSVIVRVNDRGPWKHGRLVDVSKAAALQLDFVRTGTTTVIVDLAPAEDRDRESPDATTETAP
jgi:rare lipoprotein A